MINVLKEQNTTFEDKVDLLINRHSDLMMKDPQLPLFLMGEIQQNPDFFMEKLNVRAKIQDITFEFENRETGIMFTLDIISLIFYPFIVRTAIENLFGMTHETYNALLNSRRKYLSQFLSELYSRFKQK